MLLVRCRPWWTGEGRVPLLLLRLLLQRHGSQSQAQGAVLLAGELRSGWNLGVVVVVKELGCFACCRWGERMGVCARAGRRPASGVSTSKQGICARVSTVRNCDDRMRES